MTNEPLLLRASESPSQAKGKGGGGLRTHATSSFFRIGPQNRDKFPHRKRREEGKDTESNY